VGKPLRAWNGSLLAHGGGLRPLPWSGDQKAKSSEAASLLTLGRIER